MKKTDPKTQTLLREQEMELLLSVNADFVSIRNSGDLLDVVSARLKNLIGFSQIHICTINEDDNTFSSFLADPFSPRNAHSYFKEAKEERLPVNDGFTDLSYNSEEPQVFDLQALQAQQELPEYYQTVYESGIRQVVISRLSRANKAFGFWFLLFTHSDPVDINSLRLVKGISHQISGAVLNIISNEEIAKREEEKTLLLSLTNAIAAEADRDSLAKIIRARLWDIFNIVDFCIWLNSKDKTSRIPILYDKDTPISKSPLFEEGLKLFATSNDYLFEAALASDEVIIFQEKDWSSPEQPAYVLSEFAKEFKVSGFGANRIQLADETLAVIVFSQNSIEDMKHRMPLYLSICSQLAIAISNMLAKEKIDRQFEEINQYKNQLEEEKTYLMEEISTGQHISDMIGSSPNMGQVFSLIDKVSNASSTVLILGETGTGKELVARAIHNNSGRRDKLMVKVNCAALPANLIESELFGHEKGSFTGAHDRRIGKFELANNGTLFLDEIGEMPLDLQAKILRALQEKEIERLGGKTPIKVDVRIIAATNRHLEKEVKEGRFREDLYYRLNIFPIEIPPLRERLEDIPSLTDHFIRKFAKQTGKKIKGVTKSVMKEILRYPWPGNIRELEHFIERSILLASGETIVNVSLNNASEIVPPENATAFKPRTIEDSERELIVNTLAYCSGQIAGEYGAAQILGVPRTTLHSKMKKLGITKSYKAL